MELDEQVRAYKDRLRIFLILYYFGDNYSSAEHPEYKKIFKSEVRIQKIDFLLRNPDYLAYELLLFAVSNPEEKQEIKKIVRSIYETSEPTLRRLEMGRFFFGAYEDIDDVISFLTSIGFITFTSKKSIDLKTIEKLYFVTQRAVTKVESVIKDLPALEWYAKRCELIKKYFGNLSGSQLKVAQYQIDEYRNTSFKNFIGEISETVKIDYYQMFNERL
ncbi:MULTISPECIES: hypothetical protein [unclassified Chryseobacterium]|uniref:hypothetical protein n=1 Tax=unclassified Chryseobacterium TaxID=2593645 RepID=UPI000D373967|nr:MULTISPECIES: hypothetical protein [unclassified Chryseobacterium]PTT67359.1 hypothetical protein DBR25_21290 [Chryseobacterium sp. HMWF001]PVV56551.1 hypothetical protein DD829_10675 [Chryseobacterium sp. HMWF035]